MLQQQGRGALQYTVQATGDSSGSVLQAVGQSVQTVQPCSGDQPLQTKVHTGQRSWAANCGRDLMLLLSPLTRAGHHKQAWPSKCFCLAGIHCGAQSSYMKGAPAAG